MKRAIDFAEGVCQIFPASREWWRSRVPESVLVWTHAMNTPILKLMPAHGIVPQIAFLLVFILLPILRRIQSFYPD